MERSPVKSEASQILNNVKPKEAIKTKCLSQHLVRDVFDNGDLIKLAFSDNRIKSIFKKANDTFEIVSTLNDKESDDPKRQQNKGHHQASIIKQMRTISASLLELYKRLKYRAKESYTDEWLLNETCYEFHKEQIFHFKLVKSLFDNFKVLRNDTNLDLPFDQIQKLLLKACKLGDIYCAGQIVDAIVNTRGYTNIDLIYDNWISEESDSINLPIRGSVGKILPKVEPTQSAEDLEVERAYSHWKKQFSNVISYISYLSVPITERLRFLMFLERSKLTNNIKNESGYDLEYIAKAMEGHILNQDERKHFFKSLNSLSRLEIQTEVSGGITFSSVSDGITSLPQEYFVEIEDFEDAKILIAILHELFCSHEAKEIHDRTFTKEHFVPREGSDYFKALRADMVLGTIEKNK